VGYDSALLRWVPTAAGKSAASLSERTILNAGILFYRLGDVLFAPNQELVEMLQDRTHRPVYLMKRGIDTELYDPGKRTSNDGVLRLFLIIGGGSEREWHTLNLESSDLPGILRGEELAKAYANLDVFLFPSRTDTFRNVVLESFASGVPAVVTNAGGRK